MRNKKITLVTKYKADPTATTISSKETPVWASTKSVGRTEFYEAYSSNMKPKIIVDVFPDEYKRSIISQANGPVEPTRIIVDGKEYNILRTFTKNDYSMEITLG